MSASFSFPLIGRPAAPGSANGVSSSTISTDGRFPADEPQFSAHATHKARSQAAKHQAEPKKLHVRVTYHPSVRKHRGTQTLQSTFAQTPRQGARKALLGIHHRLSRSREKESKTKATPAHTSSRLHCSPVLPRSLPCPDPCDHRVVLHSTHSMYIAPRPPAPETRQLSRDKLAEQNAWLALLSCLFSLDCCGIMLVVSFVVATLKCGM
nr:hypothetical protein CFP56_58724 [Quercus suber]